MIYSYYYDLENFITLHEIMAHILSAHDTHSHGTKMNA